jgi:3-deoxy-7-phosphoheptulonate synthase
MLIIMKRGSTRAEIDRVLQVVESLGLAAQAIRFDDCDAVTVSAGAPATDSRLLAGLSGVHRVLPLTQPPQRVRREGGEPGTRIPIGSTVIGAGHPVVIAGPCAVEPGSSLASLAEQLRAAGADLLRGGAFKPRTSPYEFQGLEEKGLRALAEARRASGLPIVTEAVDEASMDLVEEYADVVQIGARNMQNFALLKRAGRSRRPVFLKRGMSASLDEFLLAAEYVMNGGNDQVILCERGIRTFSDHSRYTLDLSVVPLLKRLTHLPVFVDPSHASGLRESVAPLARAAIVAGADGVMVEVHPDPGLALCDGPQSLLPGEFAELAAEIRALAATLATRGETVS